MLKSKKELTKEKGVKQAPTMFVTKGGKEQKIVNVSNIKKYISTVAAA